MPEKIGSRDVYNGRVFEVRVDTIRERDSTYDREIVVHHGSAVIVPVFSDGTVAMVRQYRHPAGKYLLEVPAGTLHHGEDPQAGALREVEEEVGFRAGHIEKLAEFYVSPGFLTEKMFLFLATDFTETSQNLDDDEFVEIERIPLFTAVEMAKTGQIEDAKTIVGIMLAADRLASDAS